MHARKLRRGRRRRSERHSAQIPIQLTGAAEACEALLENSQTLMLSKHGASILSQRRLGPKQELIVRRLDTGKEAKVRVAGKIADRVDGFIYVVEFVDPEVDFWEIEFAPPSDFAEVGEFIYLVCGCCGTSEAVQLGEPKLKGFEAAHGMLLYCIQCQAMTRWMQSSEM